MKIALLIDCDNITYHYIQTVLEKLGEFGHVTIRHAHGDWNSPILSGWAKILASNAVRPMQQFAYTKGKNASDLAMTIDAMDILHENKADAFAIMSSDSDFTPLAIRIRESGLPVFGFGEEKTPEAFTGSCSEFFVLGTNDKRNVNVESKFPEPVILKLRNAYGQTKKDKNRWATLSSIGKLIKNGKKPVSCKDYGYKKLTDFIKDTGLFDTCTMNGCLYIRLKDAK